MAVVASRSVPKKKQRSPREPDRRLLALFDQFMATGGLLSPGGVASLLGVTRQTVYTLGERGELRVFRSDATSWEGPAWVYIPVEDVLAYGRRVGRIPQRPEQGTLSV